MFGFGNNPDSATYNEYARQAHHAVQFLFYMETKETLVPKDKEQEVFSFKSSDDKAKIIKQFDQIVHELALPENQHPNGTEIINSKLSEAKNKDDFYENVYGLIVILNTVNYIAHAYYRNYPKSKKMLELVNILAKSSGRVLELIFQDNLNSETRKAWPHLSSLFEHYKSNF